MQSLTQFDLSYITSNKFDLYYITSNKFDLYYATSNILQIRITLCLFLIFFILQKVFTLPK
jgi:hypothetical protein